MLNWGPYLAASLDGGLGSGELIGGEAAWTLVLAVLSACCAILWTLGSRRARFDDDRRPSFHEPVELDRAA